MRLRSRLDLLIGSAVLTVLLIAIAYVGGLITDHDRDDLTPLHIPLALTSLVLATWLTWQGARAPWSRRWGPDRARRVRFGDDRLHCRGTTASATELGRAIVRDGGVGTAVAAAAVGPALTVADRIVDVGGTAALVVGDAAGAVQPSPAAPRPTDPRIRHPRRLALAAAAATCAARAAATSGT
jgi:hypothetical protein